jgi:hypothetical protein
MRPKTGRNPDGALRRMRGMIAPLLRPEHIARRQIEGSA